MSKDILDEMILEQLESKLRELLGIEESVDMLQEKGPAPAVQTKTVEDEKIGVFKKGKGDEARAARDKSKEGFLDVSAIVSSIVATTEVASEEEEEKDPRGETLSTSVEQSFETIRNRVVSKEEGLGDTAASVNNYIVNFFQQPNEENAGCIDISTIASRALINAAYFRILSAYNASTAGFVNEAFLANLLGGNTIPTGTPAFKGNDKFDNIADFVADGKHFSLKTKKASSSAEGSITNFLATLGIPFVTMERRGVKKSSEKDPTKDQDKEPEILEHSDDGSQKLRVSERFDNAPDLYYIFFGKPYGQRKRDWTSTFSISTLKISKESVKQYLKEKGVEEVSINGQEYFDLKDTSTIKKLQKDKQFVLSIKVNDLRGKETIHGVEEGQKVFKEISFNDNLEFSKKQAERLGEELTYSLNRINEFFISIERTILAYASSPSFANLNAFKKKAGTLSNAGIEIIEGSFTCK